MDPDVGFIVAILVIGIVGVCAMCNFRFAISLGSFKFELAF